MIASVPFIQKTFDRFNALCFEGVLPAVPVVLTKAGSFLGKMECRSRRDFRLKFSTGFDLSQEELEDVVIHEMIHYYIAFRRLRDTSVHGETFRSIMDTINRKYGRHISVRYHSRPGQNLVRRRGDVIRKHCICVSTFPDGSRGVTVCASNRISDMKRWLPKYFRITGMEWHISMDPFFNRFPRAHTPKIYRISAGDLEEHLGADSEFNVL